jgi:hypothetical protein
LGLLTLLPKPYCLECELAGYRQLRGSGSNSNLIELTREEWEAHRRRKMFRVISALGDAILNKSRQYKTIRKPLTPCHCSFAYSVLACFKMGMSGSASFQRVRKSL